MYESFLIVFREILEMALITGIILVYIRRTNKSQYNSSVYLAIASGIGASVFFAYLFSYLWGTFEGKNEQLFEGVTMLTAAALLTSMIFWFFKQSSVRQNLERSVDKYWNRWSSAGLFSIVFFSILREGVETVLFMSAIFARDTDAFSVAISGFAGMFAALFLGYLIFVLGKRICLRHFFLGSNILLILFAAGLMAHGVHEFQEAGLIPTFIEHLFDINYIVNENEDIGSFLKALFGYNGNPSLIETSTYLTYIIAISWGFTKSSNQKKLAAETNQ